jgi:hypothetical protein
MLTGSQVIAGQRQGLHRRANVPLWEDPGHSIARFCRAARVSNDLSAMGSDSRERVARRAKAVVVGRTLGQAGVWRRLWRWVGGQA